MRPKPKLNLNDLTPDNLQTIYNDIQHIKRFKKVKRLKHTLKNNPKKNDNQ